MSVERVRLLLTEIERLGARVEVAPSSPEEIAALRALGVAPPEDYDAFCEGLGEITIELVRTWLFYAARRAPAKTREYAEEFDSFRGQQEGPYYPSRFIVIADEGDYSNLACGWVWDAELGAFLRTDGGRWVDRADAHDVDLWTLVLEELEEIRDRLADPDDELVAGHADEIAKRRVMKR